MKPSRNREQSPKANWVRALRKHNLEYTIIVLEDTTAKLLNERETWWIAWYRPFGRLLNLSDGGLYENDQRAAGRAMMARLSREERVARGRHLAASRTLEQKRESLRKVREQLTPDDYRSFGLARMASMSTEEKTAGRSAITDAASGPVGDRSRVFASTLRRRSDARQDLAHHPPRADAATGTDHAPGCIAGACSVSARGWVRPALVAAVWVGAMVAACVHGRGVYVDAAPVGPSAPSCDVSLDAGIPRPCKDKFHVGDSRPCADCGAAARGCTFIRAAIWCVSTSCETDPACTVP